MKCLELLMCLLGATALDAILTDPVLVSENEISGPGASWWWNLKMARGDQLNGEELYYPDQETLKRNTDGGYHYWWWQNVMLKFEGGIMIKGPDTTTTSSTTSTTTTTTAAPTTTTDSYPPWPTTCRRTDTDSLGPFYWPFVPFSARTTICTQSMINNNQLDVTGYVFLKSFSDCSTMTPQANAKVEIWLADPSGNYRSECVGYVMTDSRGYYSFTSSMPGIYPGRPRHIHYQVTTDRNEKLVTQMYFESDTSGGKDSDLTVPDPEISPGHRAARFDFVL